MSLVNYSDSEEEQPIGGDCEGDKVASTCGPHLKRKRQERDDELARRASRPPPALPSNFLTLYATNVRASTTDDPILHGGRQRQVPHIVGNWPSFVYLEWLPSDKALACLDLVIDQACQPPPYDEHQATNDVKLFSSLRSDLGVRVPLHMSLSAPLTLTTDTKDAFKQQLTEAVEDAKIAAFSTTPGGIRWVSNFDETRYFLVMSLCQPKDNQLQTLLSTCNQVARSFGHPALYTQEKSTVVGVQKLQPRNVEGTTGFSAEVDDKFHISIAWSLHKPPPEQCILQKETQIALCSTMLNFENVHVKIGNHVSSILLQRTTPKGQHSQGHD